MFFRKSLPVTYYLVTVAAKSGGSTAVPRTSR